MKAVNMLMMGNSVIVDVEYGYLYNWFVISGNSTNLITDLHVPSDSEWTTLTTYLGGLSIAGGKLKEIGLTHWVSPNAGATDEFNFTSLPGGYRGSTTGGFSGIGQYGIFWSNTEYFGTEVYYRDTQYYYATVNRYKDSKVFGFSIRCMRDLTAQEQIDYADGEIVEAKTDYNGNSYNVVRIGAQAWTTTNLKATNYLNGVALTEVTNAAAWIALSTEAYCIYV